MPTNDIAVASPPHGWAFRRIVQPVLSLLQLGMSPERLAWSLAVGLVVGLNPVLGSTTLVCLAAAFALRLNIAASQISNHLVYPLELALLLPFLRLGNRIFHSPMPPLHAEALLHLARTHPITFTRHLWVWELHAMVVWCAFAIIVAPLAAFALTPLLRRLHRSAAQHRCPSEA